MNGISVLTAEAAERSLPAAVGGQQGDSPVNGAVLGAWISDSQPPNWEKRTSAV